MQIILIYEVNERQEEVKELLLQRGYLDKITGKDANSYLPSATLYKEFNEKGDSPIDSLNDIMEISEKYNLTLERAIAFEINDWCGIVGTSHNNFKGV